MTLVTHLSLPMTSPLAVETAIRRRVQLQQLILVEWTLDR